MITKKYYFIWIIIIIMVSFIVLLNSKTVRNEPLSYKQAIDKVYANKISGMALSVCKAVDLTGKNEEFFFSETGNINNNFSEDSEAGVKLWEAKELFSSIDGLKIISEGLPGVYGQGKKYYIIQTRYDFFGKDVTNEIYRLKVFVDIDNYHLFIPKYYNDSTKLPSSSTVYVEYKPNEIVKKLVKDIIDI